MKNQRLKKINLPVVRRTNHSWFSHTVAGRRAAGLLFFTICLSVCCQSLAFCSNQDIPNKEIWKITAYCPCVKCCLKTDAITASGKKAIQGVTAANNWLPFGTTVKVNNTPYIIQDRGSQSHFGSKTNHKKRIDIFFEKHYDAKKFGIQYLTVEIIK